jgi:hypothetical protein
MNPTYRKERVRRFIMKTAGTFWSDPAARDDFFDQLMQNLARFSCQGDTRYSRRILETMSGLDVENTLDEFLSTGKVCDCDILFNRGSNVGIKRST